jgi:hypothetical protein
MFGLPGAACAVAELISPPLPSLSGPAEQLPEFIDEVCGIGFRSVFLEKAGTIIPQHVHSIDHATLVGAGAARLWVDGVWREDIPAGKAVKVEAGHEHVFQALKDGTRLTCVTKEN